MEAISPSSRAADCRFSSSRANSACCARALSWRAQLELRVNAFLDQQLVTVENRIAGMRADLLARLEQLQQASATEITKAEVTLDELGNQTVKFALEV